MIAFLKEWVLNIVTLVVFLVLLEILVPTGKIKKLISLVSGFVLIIAIINPLFRLFDKGIDLREFEVSDSNFIDKKEIEENSKILKDEQMKQIVGVYRKKIIKQLEDAAMEVKGAGEVKADVIINEDYKSEKVGEIKRVYLYLKPSGTDSGASPVVKVEKIEIGGKRELGDKGPGVDSEVRNLLESKINRLLGVKNEDIVISVLNDKEG